jgi:hypothetical protein
VARREDAIASCPIDDDMTMLVYPAGQGMLAAIGYGREHAHLAPALQVVRKRSSDLPRYGKWLPTLFADGSIYVAARLGFEGSAATIADAELATARELLS